MKRALVLGGGSSLGAYEAGVVDNITANNPNLHYDIYTGISVGSINAACLAQAKEGELREYSQKLTQLWLGIEDDHDIYRKTIWGILRLAWNTGVFNPEPLRKLIIANFDAQKVLHAGNILRFGSVDLLTGKYVEATEHSDNLIDWIMASAALPFAFPAPHIGEGIYTDGGMRTPTSISAAIDAGCQEMDMVLTCPLHYEARIHQLTAKEMRNGIQLGLRLLTLMQDQIFISAMKMLQMCNDLADYGDPRYKKMDVQVYAPEKALSSDLILTDFDPILIRDWFLAGTHTKPTPLKDFLKAIKFVQEV